MPHYCVCERNGIGPDWEIHAASGVCSICGLAVHPADVRRTQAIAIAAITGNDPPEEPWSAVAAAGRCPTRLPMTIAACAAAWSEPDPRRGRGWRADTPSTTRWRRSRPRHAPGRSYLLRGVRLLGFPRLASAYRGGRIGLTCTDAVIAFANDFPDLDFALPLRLPRTRRMRDDRRDRTRPQEAEAPHNPRSLQNLLRGPQPVLQPAPLGISDRHSRRYATIPRAELDAELPRSTGARDSAPVRYERGELPQADHGAIEIAAQR